MVVNKADNKEQIDADILQCKADILRSRTTTAPYKEKNKPVKNISGEEKKAFESINPIPKEAIDYRETSPPPKGPVKTSKPENTEQAKTEIPRFDLAEAIMAEQRKITAIRRKAPGKKNETEEREAEPISHTIEQAIPTLSEQEQIVAEIVARDIEKMCRGDYSADSM